MKQKVGKEIENLRWKFEETKGGGCEVTSPDGRKIKLVTRKRGPKRIEVVVVTTAPAVLVAKSAIIVQGKKKQQVRKREGKNKK